MTEDTKPTRGGRRPGAGRKPTGRPRGRNVTFYAPAAIAEALERMPAGSRSALIVALVEQHLAAEQAVADAEYNDRYRAPVEQQGK